MSDNLQVYQATMETFQRMTDIDKMQDYVEQARSLNHRLHEAEVEIRGINAEEVHFGWLITHYPILDQV